MNRPNDELDNLLRNHFAGELDPMRGQAARAFDREVVRPMRHRLRLHYVAAAGRRLRHAAPMLASMAACAALGFYVPRWLGTPTASDEIADAAVPMVVPQATTDATPRPWQDRVETARYTPGASGLERKSPEQTAVGRTEYYVFPDARELPPGSGRQ